ncbi:MAG: hypothetical protein GY820_21970 [Gammaproteobacteria bacterium]|nr:hypothetical protein [Gammaproteobacteria bacterium]
MEYFNKIVLVTLLFVIFPAQAGTSSVTGDVNIVRVQLREAETACIQIEGNWFKLDVSTSNGKSAHSLALAAYASKTKVEAVWLDTSSLEGGCDTGTSMYPLYYLQSAG